MVVTPLTATVALGATQQFQAAVTGTSNTGVSWQVNGVSGGNLIVGTIVASGADAATYTAPAAMPAAAGITVTAVSQAESSAGASASITLTDGISVSLSPSSANVPTGGEQVFTATVSGTGSAGTSVTWSVNGISGGNSTVGTISSTSGTTALYTAPSIPLTPATVTVMATSAADASKSGTASVTITCAASNSVSPASASVALNQTQAFSASFCLAAGGSITWSVNGIGGGNSSVGTIASTGPSTALYTAPAGLPSMNPVTIQATTNGNASASATVTVTSDINVSVAPAAATLVVNQRATFTPTVANTTDTTVTWSVNGIPNGSAAVGQVCQTGSNPCLAPAGPSSASVDFLAPAAPPATDPVILTATSHADPSRSGTATILITSGTQSIAVTISPFYAFVAPSSGTASTQQFFANVTNTLNTAVTWSVASGVAGEGCAGTACGTIDASGVYTAPSAAHSLNAITVTATSQADPTKSASATVAITSGPTIEILLPSSVMAGAVEAFPLEVEGLNFVAGNGSSASAILVNGASRSTTCSSATTCTTSLNPSDVQSSGTLTIQIQNPGVPAALSNPVVFVIVPYSASAGTISLTAAQPNAPGENIVVAEPTTAGESEPINVNFIGYLTGGNTCGVQGSPLTVSVPSSGSTTVSICVNGDGLDPTFSYAFTGPGGTPDGSDIGVTASAVNGLFPGTIELDLQISSTTAPGVRTLIITTPNSDRAVATGMLEVQ